MPVSEVLRALGGRSRLFSGHATAALLRLASQGGIRTTTLRAFTADEMKGVIAKAS